MGSGLPGSLPSYLLYHLLLYISYLANEIVVVLQYRYDTIIITGKYRNSTQIHANRAPPAVSGSLVLNFLMCKDGGGCVLICV